MANLTLLIVFPNKMYHPILLQTVKVQVLIPPKLTPSSQSLLGPPAAVKTMEKFSLKIWEAKQHRLLHKNS